MLNEPASSLDDQPVGLRGMRLPVALETALEPDPLYQDIRAAVDMVMDIQTATFGLVDDEEVRRKDNLFMLPGNSKLLMTFNGRLRMASEDAYTQLDSIFSELDLLPAFRNSDAGAPHTIHVLQGRARPIEGGRWLALILFGLTVLSVLFVGTLSEINRIAVENPLRADQLLERLPAELWRGLPYAASILLILGAHELGHYFMARRHKTAASLPYFLPFPFGIFGTFGAAIRLRESMRNRKVLLDIGAAGPLAGLIFALPILLIGLATSDVLPIRGGLVEGNSILYGAAKLLVFGEFLPNGTQDVYVNQLAWAGWTGLLVTGLNLIPVGQLDGGHILYALLGKQARKLYYPIVLGLAALAFFVANELIIFIVLIILMGNNHATPLDDITVLDKGRRNLALFALAVFVLVFVPSPLTQVSGGTSTLPGNDFINLPVFTALVAGWLSLQVRWLRWR